MNSIQDPLCHLVTRLLPEHRGMDGLVRLSGGASQETWAFSVRLPDQSVRKLILRRAPFGGQRSGEAIGLANEAAIMRQVALVGAPVPNIIHVCAPDDGLGDAFIMEHVDGETIARRLLRDDAFARARAKLPYQCGQALARIHQTPLEGLPERPTNGLSVSSGLDQLDRYEAIYCGFHVDRPVFELAFADLRARAPEAEGLSLVHGDFRNGNLMVDADGLAAVLDWELAHIGDPREDLGWFCVNSWRFGVSQHAAGGFGSLDDVMAGYQAAGGKAFDTADIAWFQMLGSLKWGVMCLIMYSAFQSGLDRSVERAMIGRRASEAEIDLLNLLEGRAHA